MLEDAEGAPLRVHELAALDPTRAQHDHLARLHVTQQLCAKDVERAALRRDAVVVAEPPEREWAQPSRVAERDHGFLGHHHGRERALEARHHVGDGLLDPVRLVGGEKRGDDLRVRGAAQLHALLDELGVQLHGVDQVAVVRQRDLAAVRAPYGLRVLPRVRSRGRVANVPDGHLALERLQLLLVEDLGHEPHVAHGHDLAGVRRRDPGRFLAAMLQGEQREVGEPGDVALRREDAEDTALVARTVPVVEISIHRVDGRGYQRSPSSPPTWQELKGG